VQKGRKSTRDEKYLSLRSFSDSDKLKSYTARGCFVKVEGCYVKADGCFVRATGLFYKSRGLGENSLWLCFTK